MWFLHVYLYPILTLPPHYSLSQCDVDGDAGARIIVTALTHVNNKLRELQFQGNAICDAGAIAFTEALKHKNNQLQHLKQVFYALTPSLN